VSDLGLAGYFNESEQTDVYGGKIVGTADYLAPEQITTPDKLTPASDVYSLGCTLYYAVTGKVPFPGGSAKEKAKAHCTLPPLDPRRLNPDLSDDFVEVIAEMMAKQPENRIQTANEVARRLAPWVGAPLPATTHELSGTSLPPPIKFPPILRPIASQMSDTEPNFLVQPAEDPSQVSSPSQLSLGTQPMSGANQETLPGLHEGGQSGSQPQFTLPLKHRLQLRWHALPARIRFMIPLILATAVGAAVTAIVLLALGH
jgi:serine/threonine protein kinase